MDIGQRLNVVIATCFTAAFCALAGSQLAAWMTSAERHSVPPSARADTTLECPVSDQPALPPEDGIHNPEPDLDLFGNEVSSAVATYKLDPGGILYEEHSPQIEVPRLGVPKS